MLEDIWNWFLEVTALLVTPDWGALVSLMPIVIMALVVVWLIWVIRRFRSQPPARRGKTRLAAADAGRHPHARAVVVADLRGDRGRAALLGSRVRRPDAGAGRPGARADPAVLARRGHPELRPRRGLDRARAPGRRPHRATARRAHARPVVPAVPRRDRRDDADGRPGLRRPAPAGRRRGPDPDPRRLARRCVEGVPQRGRGRRDRSPRPAPRPADPLAPPERPRGHLRGRGPAPDRPPAAGFGQRRGARCVRLPCAVRVRRPIRRCRRRPRGHRRAGP